MRNRIHGKQLNRDSEHRRAMLRNLAAGLFEHGQIETTMPKAKAVQPFVERIITIAKKGGLNARRRIEARLTDRRIHSWVADSNVPDSRKENDWFDLPDPSSIEFNRYGELRKAPRLVQHVMTSVADRFRDRDGGYTRIVATGRHRLGDGGDIVVLQFVGEEQGAQVGGGTSGRRRQADRRTAFAASLGGDTETAVADEADEDVVADEAVSEDTQVEDDAVEADSDDGTAVTEDATDAEPEAPAEDEDEPAKD